MADRTPTPNPLSDLADAMDDYASKLAGMLDQARDIRDRARAASNRPYRLEDRTCLAGRFTALRDARSTLPAMGDATSMAYTAAYAINGTLISD